jgi:hypothetical protein
MVTTKALMSRINSYLFGCYHIDGTYKITKNGFPRNLVLIRTDTHHKVHPIAFCLSSHEQEKEFCEF